MDIKKIRELVEIVEASSLTQFTIREGELELTLIKENVEIMPKEREIPTVEEVVEDEVLFITSPMVGTFYCAAAPDLPAYVKVGDKIKDGDIVCILEAMKLMNELQCDYDCEIEAVLVSNEQKVAYGQPLFRVKKL